MTRLFKDITLEQMTSSLAAFCPTGKAFCAKDEKGTTYRNFLEGLAGELQRVYQGMNDLSEDYDILLTVELISQWESAVGIPDECFAGIGTLEERRINVLIKLAKMNVQTVDDFIALAELLGFVGIIITPLQDVAYPPYDVPFFPTSAPGSRYVVLVKGENLGLEVPPYDVPFTPAAQNSSLLQCIFDKVKPANVRFVYQNI